MAERSPSPDPSWVAIASKFPVTLAKDTAPEYLTDGQSPDSFGVGIDRPGYLSVESSVSSGSVGTQIATVSEPLTPPVAGLTWRFAHGRLWGWDATGNTLYYGAHGYDSNYLLSDLSYINCDYESSNIVDVIPFGDNVAVLKSDCLYVVNNADNPSGSFIAKYVKQSSGLSTAGQWVVVDNTLVYVNTHGVFQFDGQNIVELTTPIRSSLAPFSSGSITTLRADFEKRRVIGYTTATQFVIQLGQDIELYDYSQTGFRFTTRTLVGANAEPLLIDRVGIIYQYSAADSFYVNLDVKINDTFKSEGKFTVRPANDNGLAILNLNNAFACRKFALRITNMSSNLFISSILCHVKSGGVLGYSNK